jgi:hypothetical protein
MRNLVSIVEDPDVVSNEGFITFLFKICKRKEHHESYEFLVKSIMQVFERSPQKVPASVILALCDEMAKPQACTLLRRLYEYNKQDTSV